MLKLTILSPACRKGVANAMKAKGLGRLRWYCQVCQKQCRDDNGFKCHIATEAVSATCFRIAGRKRPAH